MREVILDTETTGMDPAEGHKIIEIGCVELENHIPTGRTWQTYINPEREVEAGAAAVHGIKTEFLKDKPIFAEVVGEFLDFIAGAVLVIHNAEFDVKFLNAELKPLGFPPINPAGVTDTLLLARRKFPGHPASLDALCRRFGVDLSERNLHGALLDSELLAKVYLELMGGRQHDLMLGEKGAQQNPPAGTSPASQAVLKRSKVYREPRVFVVPEEEEKAHKEMLENLLPGHTWQQG